MTDIEDRNYVMVLGIDWVNNQYYFTFSFANLSGGENSSGESTGEIVDTIIADSLLEATEKIALNNPRHMDFGHVKAIILGKDILEGNKFEEVLKYIYDQDDFSKTIKVFAAVEDAESIIKLDEEMTDSLGKLLEEMYDNQGVLTANVEEIVKGVNIQGSITNLLEMKIEDEKPKASSYCILKEGKYIKNIDFNQYTFLQFLNEELPYKTIKLVNNQYTIIKINTSYTIEKGEKLVINANINAEAIAMENEIDEAKLMSYLEENIVKEYDNLKKEGIDYINVLDILLIKEKSLWKQYKDDYSLLLQDIKLNVTVNIKIK